MINCFFFDKTNPMEKKLSMGNIFYSAGKSKKLNLLPKLEVDLYFKAFKLLLFFSELYLPFNKGNELN